MTIQYAAGTLVVAETTGRVLLMCRSDGGGWSHPGGMADPEDECAEETAIRELVEETGFPPILTEQCGHTQLAKLDSGEVVLLDEDDDYDSSVVLVYDLFVVTVREEFVPKLDGEHTAWAWVHPDDPEGLTGSLHPGTARALIWLMEEYG